MLAESVKYPVKTGQPQLQTGQNTDVFDAGVSRDAAAERVALQMTRRVIDPLARRG